MPRTREQLQQAAEDAERWLDALDPKAIASPDTDASRLRRIADTVPPTAPVRPSCGFPDSQDDATGVCAPKIRHSKIRHGDSGCNAASAPTVAAAESFPTGDVGA
jgi:hypothetical protein